MTKEKDKTRYNSMGTNIEERIIDGRTKFFPENKRNEAIDFAFQKRSYIGDCYYRNDEGKFAFAGYIVPN
jgi:hypothetical protein